MRKIFKINEKIENFCEKEVYSQPLITISIFVLLIFLMAYFFLKKFEQQSINKVKTKEVVKIIKVKPSYRKVDITKKPVSYSYRDIDFDSYLDFVKREYPYAYKRLSGNWSYIFYVSIPKLMTKTNEIREKFGLRKLPFRYYAVFLLEWIHKESSFKKNAKSRSGAYGLLQVKYRVWRKKFRLRSYRQLYNPRKNIDIAIDIFSGYLKKSNGYIQVALMKYNAGLKRPYKGKKYALVIMKKTRAKIRKLTG